MCTISSWKPAVSTRSSPNRSMLTDRIELEDSAAQAKALSEAIKEIPKAHRDTLQFLVFHLSRVIEHQDENLVCGQLYTMNVQANILSDDATQPCCRIRTNDHASYGYPARAERCSTATRCRTGFVGELQARFW